MGLENFKTVIGIDPGAKGGICYGDIAGQPFARNLPTTARQMYDLMQVLGERNALAFVEIENTIPGASKQSLLTASHNHRRVRDLLEIAGIPYIDVNDTSWQDALGVKMARSKPLKEMDKKEKYEHKKGRKNMYKDIAARRHPQLSPTLLTCDAILIYDFGVTKLLQDPEYIYKKLPAKVLEMV